MLRACLNENLFCQKNVNKIYFDSKAITLSFWSYCIESSSQCFFFITVYQQAMWIQAMLLRDFKKCLLVGFLQSHVSFITYWVTISHAVFDILRLMHKCSISYYFSMQKQTKKDSLMFTLVSHWWIKSKYFFILQYHIDLSFTNVILDSRDSRKWIIVCLNWLEGQISEPVLQSARISCH